ncbi:MAG: methylmalonyl-CoA mutase subunit beta, partial [Rhizobiales bacterium]|nr:methylmalonyl-CoA mutase subunit beta [Hyphomicrobiales bacterium]
MNSGQKNDAPLMLASEFPPATREQWRKLVEATLKGANFDKRLVSKTYDGLRIEPLYDRRKDALPLASRQAAAPWQVLQRVDHPNTAAANAQALHDLENGATGLWLVFAGSIGAHGFGLSPDDAARVLDGVHLDAGIAIECDLSPQSKDAAKTIATLVTSRGIAPKDTNIRFGFDPLGAMAASGQSPLRWNELSKLFSEILSGIAGQGFPGPFAVADARVIHDAGGSEAQELGYALGVAVAYLRALEAHGIALDAARRLIFFRLAADADLFLTIAKFRALRKLWARVDAACGLAPLPVFISAETAWRMMTKRDPYVNMLRTTIAAFAAGLGGANAISILPYTSALGLPDDFARRLARNTQLILLEESNLAKVSDASAGSGGVEDLTDKLCAASWSLFQEIEAAGGAPAALEAGLLQAKVMEVRKARENAIATRKDALIGTSEFPDIAEATVAVLDVAPVTYSPPPLRGRSAREASRQGGEPQSSAHGSTPLPNPPPQGGRENTQFKALPAIRLAEPYERLRDAADRAASAGKRPKVFLANVGSTGDFTERATFAKNFFEAGGIEAVEFFPSPPAGEGGEARNASRVGR